MSLHRGNMGDSYAVYIVQYYGHEFLPPFPTKPAMSYKDFVKKHKGKDPELWKLRIEATEADIIFHPEVS